MFKSTNTPLFIAMYYTYSNESTPKQGHPQPKQLQTEQTTAEDAAATQTTRGNAGHLAMIQAGAGI